MDRQNRISGLPDAILSRILSSVSTRDALKTSVLSHRWFNVWASVPNLRLTQTSPKEFSRFAGYVDQVLFFRGSSKIHAFKLRCKVPNDDFSRIDSRICTAVRRNVAELELDLFVDLTPNTYQGYQLPRRLLMCNTLVVLKLTLHCNDITVTPSSGCFPSLKFLHATVHYPVGDLMEKLFSCCPVLEDLIINGDLEEDSILNFNVSAPNLKRLRISLHIDPFPFDGDDIYRMGDYNYKILVNVNAPNLEEFNLLENFLASYSFNHANLLSKAKIDLGDMHVFNNLDFVHKSADRIYSVFAAIINVTHISLSAPAFGHLELQLQACCSWQFLTKLLKISRCLEYLVIETNIKCSLHLNEPMFVHEWCPTELVPICLSSRVKTICIRGLHGRPDEMERRRDVSTRTFNVPKGFKDLSS
ncbi:F-box/LRR-repeat protein At4g14103-like [Pyrus communis]|uniref:F-box/LRR-repeat protein At4g14103-like n=1 Tax=Pyrus communis TaxID=23211 RepID=UPI0035C11B55